MGKRSEDIEALARMAARLAGRNPDEHLLISLGDAIPFDGPMWRYPDFLARAEAAYQALTSPTLAVPSLNGNSGKANVGADRDSRIRIPTP